MISTLSFLLGLAGWMAAREWVRVCLKWKPWKREINLCVMMRCPLARYTQGDENSPSTYPLSMVTKMPLFSSEQINTLSLANNYGMLSGDWRKSRPCNFNRFFFRRRGNIALLLNSRRLRLHPTTRSSLGEDLFVGAVVLLQPLFLVVCIVEDEVRVSIDGVQIRRQC